jgi:hypothetical protein
LTRRAKNTLWCCTVCCCTCARLRVSELPSCRSDGVCWQYQNKESRLCPPSSIHRTR